MALIGPEGQQYANVGTALHLARLGEFGSRRQVTLTQEGYTNTVIAKGGPAGWYVKELGNKRPAARKPIVIGKRVV